MEICKKTRSDRESIRYRAIQYWTEGLSFGLKFATEISKTDPVDTIVKNQRQSVSVISKEIHFYSSWIWSKAYEDHRSYRLHKQQDAPFKFEDFQTYMQKLILWISCIILTE